MKAFQFLMTLVFFAWTLGSSFATEEEDLTPKGLLGDLGALLDEISKAENVEANSILSRISEWRESKLKALEEPRIRILHPDKDASVERFNTVIGRVSDPEADVWIIVRPVEVSDFYVQPPVNVMEDGTWEAKVYFGEEGSLHRGKEFIIRALANPEKPLKEKDKLSDWPKAKAQSQLVKVKRK